MPVNQRTLSDLESEVRELGLKVDFPITKTGKIKKTKKACIEVLRSHYLKEKYGENVPSHLELILSMESPMLADRIFNKNTKLQEEIWKSVEWGFQEKVNGCRMLIVYDRITGLHFYSRGVSVQDYLPIDYTQKILHRGDEVALRDCLGTFVIDSEVICTDARISTILGSIGVITETQLQAVSSLLALDMEHSIKIQEDLNCPLRFYVFDAVYYDGHWLDEKNDCLPQLERERVSRFIVDKMVERQFNTAHLDTVYEEEAKRQFYDSIIENKDEGVVAKHKGGYYRAVEARSRNTWVKIKRSVKESLTSTPFNDTVDAFVSGYSLGTEDKGNAGLVGSIHFSLWLLSAENKYDKHEIARVSSIPSELRKRITGKDEKGKPGLVQEMYGKVAEVDGQAISARSRRLSHATIVVWRNDKRPDECTLDESFLNDMIM